MAMLHAFASHLPRPDFFVVTVNHNIRATAQDDCLFVKQYCDGLGVKCLVKSVDVPTYAKQNKLSTETSARILRYQALETLDCDYVCLAHHADDNAETVLMHVLRGSGAQGASGIKQFSGKYFRPMLSLTRKQIEQYVAQHDVPYVTDDTNADVNYTRNFVRHNVMPQLQAIYPTATENIVRFAQTISADNDYLNALADVSTVTFDDEGAHVPLPLLTQPYPIASRVVYKVFARLGVHHDIEKSHVVALVNLAQNNGGKKLTFPFGYRVTNDYTCVTISLERQKTASQTWQVPFALGNVQTPFGTVEVSKTKRQGALMVDLDKIDSSAVFRPKQSGDVFCKFGGGSKPLRKYLIDIKYPQRKRDELVVLASGQNVLAVCGVQISNDVKVTPQSNVVYISLTKEN